MRRLPPLTAIEAFVQVARTGSIKAASQELALSPPALSRRIQALERFIGRPLFERRHQAVVLNADGDRLLQQIAPALEALSEELGEKMTVAKLNIDENPTITVAADAAITAPITTVVRRTVVAMGSPAWSSSRYRLVRNRQ